MKRPSGFRTLVFIGILLNTLFVAGQTLSLVDYDLTVALGLQESAAEISDAGIAFAKGFAFGDTVFYIPLFVTGMIGLLKRRSWGVYFTFGALAITVYWPIVHLFAVYAGKSSIHLSNDKYVSFLVILPLTVLYGLWGMWFLYKNRQQLSS